MTRLLCSNCKDKPRKFSHKKKDGTVVYHKLCWTCSIRKYTSKEDHNDNIKFYRKKLKSEVITRYGGQCNCCAEKELAFLTIDHINDRGAEHRKKLGMRGGPDFYLWLRKKNYPKGYQVLCFNCNWAKFTIGVCPHQKSSVGS